MPVTPKPLTKTQRQKATAARKLQERIARMDGALVDLRWQRDRLLAALLDDGVRPFVITNETGIDRHTVTKLKQP